MANKSWRNNPVFVSLTMITLVSVGITAIGTLTGAYDASHTSQVELDVVDNRVTTNSVESECRHLLVMIDLVESAIWQMKQAGDESQRLNEKERQLTNLNARYNELHCASVLKR